MKTYEVLIRNAVGEILQELELEKHSIAGVIAELLSISEQIHSDAASIHITERME